MFGLDVGIGINSVRRIVERHGINMDNFMDKLAQKLNAQEVIKANSQAEAAEMKKLQMQVAEYEKILQEMRKLNYKNAELSEKIDVMVGENAGRIKDLQEEELRLLSVLRDVTDEQIRNREDELAKKEEEKLAAIQDTEEKTKRDMDTVENLFKRSDDFVHKENVKVYRNVQAVVIDELKKQTDALVQENNKLHSHMNLVMIVSAITLCISVAGIILQILTGLNIKLF